ncbi:MAG: DNA polymerase I [Bacteroidales bacterium]|nr:DNA polymerase I [Bacteroidales bacterium]
MKKLFLIDGHSLIFRMYYAFLRRPMINSKGVDTSILYGFMKYLMELIRKENPTHIGVAFDPPGKTFRHESYDAYKSNRSATPELVKEALEPLKELVSSLGIPVLMIPGYEADDVIGTIAKMGERQGFTVYMVTPDKDLGQLISENIFQYKPGKSGAENELLGTAEICEKFQISHPSQVIDILALWGDASDNVPGVRGVGEVSAKKLIAKYGSVENILAHTSELPAKQAAAFEEAREQLPLSKFLVTIKTDVPIEFSEESLLLEVRNGHDCHKLFEQYEFPSLLKLLPATFGDCSCSEEVKKEEIALRAIDMEELLQICSQQHETGIRISGENLFLSSGESVYTTSDWGAARAILEDESVAKVGYNLKEYIHTLRSRALQLKGPLKDIELMHYLLNPERTHKLEILAKTYLDIDVNNIGAEAEAEPVQEFDLFSAPAESAPSDTTTRDKAEASVLIPLYKKVSKELEADPSLVELYHTIEEPLLKVLANIEEEGFKIDTGMLLEFKNELLEKMNTIQERIRECAENPELNISSPKQIGILLYEKLALNPKVKKNAKDSYPTDEETLLSMEEKSPIIKDILDFRGLKKLISTYIEPFPSLIDPKTGKVHTTFNQALTATGRLSSVKPNLQNIPIRTELGREIRKAFIPSHPDGYIVSADYSQIELRLMAAMSGDKELVAAFREGKDVHTATAAKVFKVGEDQVTSDQRRKAKMVNFGIIYGISAFGLAQRLHIGRGESKEIIEEYFRHYPDVWNYMEKMKESAREKGYVETLCKRKRYLPDINSRNVNVKNLAERNAINAPIQGSAADIIKLAMINVEKRFAEEGFESKVILQVHDELVIDTTPSELDRVMRAVKEEMERVMDIGIPLTAECNYGKNWLEAH